VVQKVVAIATPAYARIVVEIFEVIDFLESKSELQTFDTIIRADLLEQLVNPWLVRQRLRVLVTGDGALFVGMANVRNLNVLANLAKGKGTYEGARIQDIIHLRFITGSTLVQMLKATGWSIDEIRVGPDPSLNQALEGASLLP